MAQPTPYERSYSFTDYQIANPADPLPADQLDGQLNLIQQTIAQILANLEIIQRDDTALGNETVGIDQLKPEVTFGINAVSEWSSGIAYVLNDAVWNEGSLYRCIVAHTSTVFATNLASDYWDLILDLPAEIAAVAASAIAVVASTAAVNPAVTTVLSSAAAVTLNLAVSRVFKHTFTENTTFTFSNPDATGTRCGFELYLINDGTGRTPTWPAAVKWTNGVVPSLATASEKNNLYFVTIDGGTTWIGHVTAEAYA